MREVNGLSCSSFNLHSIFATEMQNHGQVENLAKQEKEKDKFSARIDPYVAAQMPEYRCTPPSPRPVRLPDKVESTAMGQAAATDAGSAILRRRRHTRKRPIVGS